MTFFFSQHLVNRFIIKSLIDLCLRHLEYLKYVRPTGILEISLNHEILFSQNICRHECNIIINFDVNHHFYCYHHCHPNDCYDNDDSYRHSISLFPRVAWLKDSSQQLPPMVAFLLVPDGQWS